MTPLSHKPNDENSPAHAPLWLRGTPMTAGSVLWFVQALCWRMPPRFWPVGNAISDLRFRLYNTYGWEWI